MNYKEQLKTDEWKEKRQEIIDIYGNRCVGCGCKSKIEVHHTRYFSGLMAWEYSNDNLAPLCPECHANFHQSKEIIQILLSDSNLFHGTKFYYIVQIVRLLCTTDPSNYRLIVDYIRKINS